jgi:hypothetical protein
MQNSEDSMSKTRWGRTLVVVGLAGMAIGALDPMEGSLVILPSTGVAAMGAMLDHTRRRHHLYWSFALVTVGVGAMWGFSSVGGIGGNTGRSMWWSLTMTPYPLGWILGLAGAIGSLRQTNVGTA